VGSKTRCVGLIIQACLADDASITLRYKRLGKDGAPGGPANSGREAILIESSSNSILLSEMGILPSLPQTRRAAASVAEYSTAPVKEPGVAGWKGWAQLSFLVRRANTNGSNNGYPGFEGMRQKDIQATGSRGKRPARMKG